MVNAPEGLSQVILRKVRRFRTFVCQKRSFFIVANPSFQCSPSLMPTITTRRAFFYIAIWMRKSLWQIARCASNGNENSQSSQLYPNTCPFQITKVRHLDFLQNDDSIRYTCNTHCKLQRWNLWSKSAGRGYSCRWQWNLGHVWLIMIWNINIIGNKYLAAH